MTHINLDISSMMWVFQNYHGKVLHENCWQMSLNMWKSGNSNFSLIFSWWYTISLTESQTGVWTLKRLLVSLVRMRVAKPNEAKKKECQNFRISFAAVAHSQTSRLFCRVTASDWKESFSVTFDPNKVSEFKFFGDSNCVNFK